MRGQVSRHTQRFVYAFVLLCLFEIGHSAWERGKSFTSLEVVDGPTHIISIFKPFRSKIPYQDKFNVLLEEGSDVAVKRLAQFALAPRRLREGTDEAWLVYYSTKNLPLPTELAAEHELIAQGKAGASLYRRKIKAEQ